MASTPVPVTSPFALKTATVTLTVGTEVSDFSDHVGEIRFTPSTSSSSWTAVSGKVIRDASAATWEVALGLVQDLAPTGLLRYLQTHQGQKATLDATFATGTDPVSAVVTLTPAGIGGAADGNVNSISVTLPMDGDPEWHTTGGQG